MSIFENNSNAGENSIQLSGVGVRRVYLDPEQEDEAEGENYHGDQEIAKTSKSSDKDNNHNNSWKGNYDGTNNHQEIIKDWETTTAENQEEVENTRISLEQMPRGNGPPAGYEFLIKETVINHYVFVVPGSTIYNNAARKWEDCKERVRGVIHFILSLVQLFQNAEIFMEAYEKLISDAAENKSSKKKKGESGESEPPASFDFIFGEGPQKPSACQPPKLWYEIIPSEKDHQHRAAYAIHILNTNPEIDVVRIAVEYLCMGTIKETKQQFAFKNMLKRFKHIPNESLKTSAKNDSESLMTQSELISILEIYRKFGVPSFHYDPNPKICAQDNLHRFFLECMSPRIGNAILQAQSYRKSVLIINPKTKAALIPDGNAIQSIGRSLKELDFIPVRLFTAVNPLQMSFPDEALLNEASFINKILSMRYRTHLEEMPQWEIERQEALGKIMNNCDEGACYIHDTQQHNSEEDESGLYAYLRTSNDVFKILWVIYHQEFELLQSQGNYVTTKEEYLSWSDKMRSFNEKRFMELRDYILSPIASSIVQRLMSPPIKSCREFLNVTCGSPDGKRRLFFNKASESYCEMMFPYSNMDTLANFLVYVYEVATKILCIGKVNINIFLAFIFGGMNQFLMVPHSDGNALNYNVVVQGTSGGGKSHFFQLLTQIFIQGTTTQMDSKSHQSGISDTLMNAFVRFNDELPPYYLINQFGSSEKDAQPLEQEKTLETKGSLLREVCVMLPNGKRITQMFQTDVHGARFIATNKPESAIDPTIKTRKLFFTKIPPAPSEIQRQQQQADRCQTANPSVVRDFKSIMQSLQTCIMMSFVSRNIYAVVPMDYKKQTVFVLALEKMLDYLHKSNVFIREDLYPNRVKEGVVLFANTLCMIQGWVEYCLHPSGAGYQAAFDDEWIKDVARLQYPRLQAIAFSLCVHLECFIPPSMTTVINGVFEKVIPVELAIKEYFLKNWNINHIPFVSAIDTESFYLLCVHDWLRKNFKSYDFSSTDIDDQHANVSDTRASFFSANGPSEPDKTQFTSGGNRHKFTNNNGDSSVGIIHAAFRTRQVNHEQYVDVNYISVTVDSEYALSRSFLQKEKTKSVYDEKTLGLGYELLRRLMVYPVNVYKYIQENEFPDKCDGTTKVSFGNDTASEKIMKGLWEISIYQNFWNDLVATVSKITRAAASKRKERWKKFFLKKQETIISFLLKTGNNSFSTDNSNSTVINQMKQFFSGIDMAISKTCCNINGTTATTESQSDEPIFKAAWKRMKQNSSSHNWFSKDPESICPNSSEKSLTYLEVILTSAFADFIPSILEPSTTFLEKLRLAVDGESICAGDKNHIYQKKNGFPGLQVERTANNRFIYHFHVALFQRDGSKTLKRAIERLGCFVTVPRTILVMLDCVLGSITLTPLPATESENGSKTISIETNPFIDKGPERCPEVAKCDLDMENVSIIKPDRERRHIHGNRSNETARGRWVREIQNTSGKPILLEEDLDIFFARVYLEQLGTPWKDIHRYLPINSVAGLYPMEKRSNMQTEDPIALNTTLPSFLVARKNRRRRYVDINTNSNLAQNDSSATPTPASNESPEEMDTDENLIVFPEYLPNSMSCQSTGPLSFRGKSQEHQSLSSHPSSGPLSFRGMMPFQSSSNSLSFGSMLSLQSSSSNSFPFSTMLNTTTTTTDVESNSSKLDADTLERFVSNLHN